VLSAGTESINSLQKYFGYVKDARNPALITLTITPGGARIGVGKTVQFLAIVRNSPNTLVEWKLLAGPGAIDKHGKFTSSDPGVAQIAAISRADPATVATAEVQIA
jgi:hypothetical protein